MNYLKEYFNDDLSLDEWRSHYLKYAAYLSQYKNHFDEETYQILSTQSLHDANIQKVYLDGHLVDADSDDVFANLTVIVKIVDDIYEIFYEKIKEFSLETVITYNSGFEDILIDECSIEKDFITHELVFVGEKPWMIKCKKLSIKKL